jgi:hypothetical protein
LSGAVADQPDWSGARLDGEYGRRRSDSRRPPAPSVSMFWAPPGVEVLGSLALTEIAIASESAELGGGCGYGLRKLVDQSAVPQHEDRQG